MEADKAKDVDGDDIEDDIKVDDYFDDNDNKDAPEATALNGLPAMVTSTVRQAAIKEKAVTPFKVNITDAYKQTVKYMAENGRKKTLVLITQASSEASFHWEVKRDGWVGNIAHCIVDRTVNPVEAGVWIFKAPKKHLLKKSFQKFIAHEGYMIPQPGCLQT